MDYLNEAIKSLRPGAEFAYYAEDYSTITWSTLDGEAPTIEEIDAEIERIKADEITFAANRATAKAALLDRLGLTEADAKLLLS